MSNKPTIGERLLTLKEYSGLSLAQIAKRGGYQAASSVQKLFRKDYNPESLTTSTVERLVKAFEGCGDPPIEALELRVLGGEATDFESAVAGLHHYTHVISKWISLERTKRIAATVQTESGAAIPLFIRVENSSGFHFPCPEHLRSKQMVGLYVTVGNMWPRYEEGEIIFYEHRRPAVIGDDVIVNLVNSQHIDGGMIIGRLHLLHDEEVQIDQLSPEGRIVIPRTSVIWVHRLVQRWEMLLPARHMLEPID